MSELKQNFDAWCIVEIFGHQKIAGHCTEQNVAGTNFLRVDVPETENTPAFTKFYGASAIFAINPVDEHTARTMAAKLEVKPIEAWNISEVMKKYQEKQLLLEQVKKDEHVNDLIGETSRSHEVEDELDDLPY